MTKNNFINQRQQKGFTLVELAVAMVISGMLFTGFSVLLLQSMTESSRSYSQTQAIQQLENTGFWICRDIQMAQTITTGPNAGFPLQAAWEDANGDIYEVEFSISGGEVQRSIVKNGGPPSQTILAQSIDPLATNCSYANQLLTLNLSARADNENLSRTFQVKKRPGSF